MESYQEYLEEVRKTKRISPEREKELARLIQSGCPKAKEELVTANLRLVVKVALNFRTYGVPVEDLIQEGNIGLMIAAERYDPELCCKFGTYATHWIKQKIQRCIGDTRTTIRIPAHVNERIRKGDIKDEMKFKAEKARDGSMNFDLISQDLAFIPKEDLREVIEYVLSSLTPKERVVMVKRFGIGCKPCTFRDIANQDGVTHQAIQKRYTGIVTRLRAWHNNILST